MQDGQEVSNNMYIDEINQSAIDKSHNNMSMHNQTQNQTTGMVYGNEGIKIHPEMLSPEETAALLTNIIKK